MNSKLKHVFKLRKMLQEKNVELNDVELDQVRNYALQNCNELNLYWASNFIKLHMHIIMVIYKSI